MPRPIVLVVSLLALVSGACQAAPAAGPSAAQGADEPRATVRLVAGMFSDPPGFHKELTNPGGTTGSVAGLAELWQLVHAAPTYADERDVVHPWLAEAVPSVDNGLWAVLPDGRMETTWHLRPDVRWHDGAPMTADDLLFTLEVNRDQEIGIANPPALKNVEGAEAPDPSTVLVRWKAPFIEADTLFTPALGMPLPKHILESEFRDNKPNFLNLPYWQQAFVGVGAYRLKEWVPGSHALLVANGDYVLGRPRIDEIEVRFIAEINALVASLLAGAIQKPIGRGLNIQQVLAVRDASSDINISFTEPLGNSVPIYPQLLTPDPPIVANPEFRRALMTALDRQEMTDTINFGLGPVADAWLQPDRPEYPAVADKIVRYPFDPRRAEQMLGGLGYTKGSDGVFHDPRGETLSFVLRTTDGSPMNPPAAYSTASYWQRLGIAVTTLSVPTQLVPDREYRSQFPAFELVISGITPRSSAISLFKGSSTPLPENQFQGGNRARYMNPQLDGLIDRYLVTIPVPERLAVLGDILHLQTDQLTILTLFSVGGAAIVGSNRLKNVTNSKVYADAYLWTLD